MTTESVSDVPGDGGPIPGEPVTLDAIQPTPEAVEADRKNRISRTDAQVLTGATVVTVLVWLLRLNGIDLNPLPDNAEIPAEVAAALGAMIGAGVSRWMNRSR